MILKIKNTIINTNLICYVAHYSETQTTIIKFNNDNPGISFVDSSKSIHNFIWNKWTREENYASMT